MIKVELRWISSQAWGQHEAYFVNGVCIGVFTGLCGGIMEKVCKQAEIEFIDTPCTDDEWRDMIISLSNFGKPKTND